LHGEPSGLNVSVSGLNVGVHVSVSGLNVSGLNVAVYLCAALLAAHGCANSTQIDRHELC
jgi:hypothetical protein